MGYKWGIVGILYVATSRSDHKDQDLTALLTNHRLHVTDLSHILSAHQCTHPSLRMNPQTFLSYVKVRSLDHHLRPKTCEEDERKPGHLHRFYVTMRRMEVVLRV